MSIQDLGAIGELIAAIATVGTLIYLAVQIRHNSRTNEISAELECLKLLTDWVGRVSDNPERQRIYDMSADQSQTMSEEESRQYLWLIGEFGWIAQTAFVQHQRGYYRAPRPTATELAQLLHRIGVRVARLLERQGLLIRDPDRAFLDLEPAEAFDQLVSASIHYRIAIGPWRWLRLSCSPAGTSVSIMRR